VVCTDNDVCNGLETCDSETGLCQLGNDLDCDDADACTADNCDALEGCAHAEIDCDDLAACTVDFCDAVDGCFHEAVICDDNNPCNGLELCDATSGLCDVGTPLDCDDQNACTFDECAPRSGCNHSSSNCDDTDPCTIDSCDTELGCLHVPVVCDDGNLCNGIESCNVQFGECGAGTPLICDDGNACTGDACEPLTGCTTSPVNCDDINACTLDGCDEVLGCKHDLVVCDDGTVCNGLEACDPVTGACVPGTPAECDDEDTCTFDKCSPTTGCQHTRFACDDDDLCTADSCDPIKGCAYTPVMCEDGNVCNGAESCNPKTGGCDAGPPPDCDDLDACSVDSCDPAQGCIHGPLACDDGDPCTTDSCDPSLGCSHAPVVCADADACNGIEVCNPVTGVCDAGSPSECDDQDECTVDSCDAGFGCVHTERACDDGDLCTIDSCNPELGCGIAPVSCDDANPCNGIETCNPESGACDNGDPPVCDDGDACTIDACDTLTGCTLAPVSCDDQNSCTVDACSPAIGCEHTATNCDDADPCTVDSCDAMEGCAHIPVVCDDANLCNGLETCNPQSGVCESGAPPACDDDDPCTVDSCEPTKTCVHTPVNCDDGNVCNGLEVCEALSGLCQPGTTIDCDDRNACTTDACDPVLGCQSMPLGCDDGDLCTKDSCDSVGGCAHVPVVCIDADLCNGSETCNPQTGICDAGVPLLCDDDDACTLDGCDAATGCTVGPISCNDQDACTADSCDSVSGCEHSAVDCDDQDACTIDSCDLILGCAHIPVVCDDGNVCNGLETCDAVSGACNPGESLDCDDQDACTADRCSPALGCEHAAVSCDDGNLCTVDSCDVIDGCRHEPLACDDQNVCDGLESCNPESGKCQPGTPLDCNDHDACTLDTCDPANGCASAPIACDDQDPCTVDSCDSKLGCRVEPLCEPGYGCAEGECSCMEPRGDRDGDGDRDLGDLTYFLLCIRGPGDPVARECECQDTNDDDHVDLLDLAEFLGDPQTP
jgi:hypothetical protein